MRDDTSSKWQTVKIGDVCSLMTGGTPSRTKPDYFKGDIKWLVSGDIHHKEIIDCDGRISELGLANSNARLLPVNSVMIALNGQGKTRGTVAMLRTEATCNQSLVSIMPKDTKQLLPEFVYMNLYGRYDEIRKMTGDAGNERRGLNMRLIRGIEIPLPPLEEQQRIVAVLDEAFEGLARARANAEVNLQNARELFGGVEDSVLSPAISNAAAKRVLLEDVADLRGGFAFKSKQYRDDGHFVLRTVNITKDGGITRDNAKFISESEVEAHAKFALQPIDTLFVMVGATLGKTGLVLPSDLPALLNQNMWVVRAIEGKVDPIFLHFLFRRITRDVLGKATGTARGFLKRDDVRKLAFGLPSLSEQQKITEALEGVQVKLREAEASYVEKLVQLDDLRQSLLQKAFAGELT